MGFDILGRRRGEHLGRSDEGLLQLEDAIERDVTELPPRHGCPRSLPD